MVGSVGKEDEEKKLPEPEGICKYCGKPIYFKLAEHELICKYRDRWHVVEREEE